MNGRRNTVSVTPSVYADSVANVCSTGDVISVSAFGQRLVVLNTLEACIELLDKRGAIYSERPILPMVGKLMGWAEQLVLLPLGENFRNQRRFLHRHLGSRNQLHKMEPWNPLVQSKAKEFLQRSLTDGAKNIVPNLHRSVSAATKHPVDC